VSGTAVLSDIAGSNDSVAVALTSDGTVTLRAAYTLTAPSSGGSISLGAPSGRVAGDFTLETERSFTVSAPRLTYAVLPAGLVTAGASLGGVRVDIVDARGALLTNATDSVVIALDPASGTPGATLFGATGARAIGGQASFPGLSIQRAGSAYRLIASSAAIATRDTATTFIVAGTPSAANSAVAIIDSVRGVGQTTTVTVTLRDQFGNLVTGATAASLSGSTTLGTLGGFTCVSGVCTATYSATTVGTASIAVSVGGSPVTSSPSTVRVTPGPAVRLVITGANAQTAGSPQNITITAYDAFGNIATDYDGLKNLTFGGASAAPNGTTLPTVTSTSFSATTGITFVNGVATNVPMTLYRVESALITVTDGTLTSTGGDRLAVTVTAATPSPTTVGGGAAGVTSSITVSRDTLEVGDSLTVTVRLFDAYGNAIAAATAADFTTSASAGTLGAFSCVDGVCTARWLAPTAPGAQTIGASIGGSPVNGSPAPVVVEVGDPDPTTSTLSVVASTITQGNTTTVQITVRDRFGNVVTNAKPADISATTTIGTIGAFTCSNGVCSATFTGSTPGTATITGSVGGVPMSPAATIQVTAAAAAKLVITGTGTQVAGTTQNITITARDANGNVAVSYTGSKSLTFDGASVSPNGSAPSVSATDFGTPTAITFTDGVASAVAMTLVTAETAIIAATDGSISAAGIDRLTVSVSANDASPVVSDIQASPASIAADGVASSVLTLQLKDLYGNVTTSVASPSTVEIIQSAGTGSLTADFTNLGGGTYTQTVVSAAAAGTGTFQVRLNGVLGTTQTVVTYIASGGVLSRLVCTESQAASQSAASNTTVALCANTAVGDLEIVTLALDGVDDIVAPTTPADGNWVKISSTLQSSGSGGNKAMLLVLYARRYAAGNSRSVTFTAATNHKWSVDMVTFVSSGTAVPSGADIIVAQNTTGAGLTTPGLTAFEDNTVLYYVMANSLTGNLATPNPDGLTVLANNNSGGTSSASYMELLATTGDVAPARTWVNTKTANTVLVQLLVRP
jgi:hypothetical protein